MNIFSRSKSVEIVTTHNLHNYRFIGEEMEVLGTRLDAVRKSLKQARTAWARWYWQEALDRLLMQWRALPVLHDGQAQSTLLPRWTVDYNYWESNQEVGGLDFTDKMFHKICQSNLNESWERIRTERIMKCNCQ